MMDKDKKKTTSKRLGGFWRSYSFVLTLVVLASLSIVAVSADFSWSGSRRIWLSSGRLYWARQSSSGGWVLDRAVDTSNGDGSLVSVLNDVLSVSSGGGMTLDEFSSYFNTWSNTAGLLRERLSEFLYAESAFDQYLDADGQIKTATTASSGSERKLFNLATLLSNALRGINTNMNSGFLGLSRNLVGSSGTTRSITLFRSYGTSFSQSYSDILTLFGEFASGNHSLLNSMRYDTFQIDYRNRTFFPRFESALIGSGSAAVTYWDSSTKADSVVNYNNLLSAITAIGSPMQNDLAKLRYVLASDQDIEISEKQAPVKDAVADNFAGDSPAAVKDADVGDMAGFSGSLQDSLSTGANAGDVFSFIGGSGGVGFWSQEVASDLDCVPVTAFEDDEDYIHFYDPSIISDYLSGGE